MSPAYRQKTANSKCGLTACLVGLVVVSGHSITRADGRPDEPNCQDEFWSHLKDMRAGPVTFDLGGRDILDRDEDAWYTTGLKAYRRDSTGASGISLGTELDFRLVWNPLKHLEIIAGRISGIVVLLLTVASRISQ